MHSLYLLQLSENLLLSNSLEDYTLRKKRPNMEFFLVGMRENTDQKKNSYLDTFHAGIGIVHSHKIS